MEAIWALQQFASLEDPSNWSAICDGGKGSKL